MKRMTYFVMALALVLGLAQCKKEKLETPQNEGNSVMITLDVKGDNNAKVYVDPPNVTFEEDDEIVVACNGHYVGTLKHNGTNFSGNVTNATPDQPLYFYFFGNVSPQYFDASKDSCSVYIGEQRKNLPVISMGPSIDATGKIVNYQDGTTSYTARLHNKCSLMKFNVTNDSDSTIIINGMNNFVNVSFKDHSENDGFSYKQVYNGKIEMKGQEGSGQKTYWAIVLPQDYVAEGIAYTEDYSYIGTRPAIEGGIGINQYYSDGVTMTMESFDPLAIPLTFEAKTAGVMVSLDRAGDDDENAPDVYLQISTDGDIWTTYTIGDYITLAKEGDKVMFRATDKNIRFAKSPEACHTFYIDGYCYVYGNIMSLLNKNNYATLDQLSALDEYIFESLFAGCTGLCDHPQKPLELPATGLADYCYSHMFLGCSNLFVAPKLPARDLAEGCYQGMFERTGLEESPVLPAATLVSNCYSSMFNNCESLNRITCLATSGINSDNSTTSWLSGVAARGTFIKASDASWSTGDSAIPSGWAVENY